MYQTKKPIKIQNYRNSELKYIFLFILIIGSFILMSKTLESHILRKYSIIKEIGSGAYGHVWEVTHKQTNQRFALKKVFDAFRNEVDAQRTYRQVEILSKLEHPNIIKLNKVHRAFNNKDLYLVFQYMEADLHSLVGSNILKKMHQIYVFYQLLKAIKYLHSASLIHRDLKPSNVLVNSQCTIKLCDFGLVRCLLSQTGNQQNILSQEVATKWYRAPQLLLGTSNYDKPVDIWSFGCIALEILCGKPQFTGDSTISQLEQILGFTGPTTKSDLDSLNSPIIVQILTQITNIHYTQQQILQQIEPQFHELLIGCLQLNPNRRLTVDEALDLPLFDQFCSDEKKISQKPIIPVLDDNKRYSVKKYREQIYEDIYFRYEDFEDFPFKNKTNLISPLFKKSRKNVKSFSSGKRELSNSVSLAGFAFNRNQSCHKNQKKSFRDSPYYKSLKKVLARSGTMPYKQIAYKCKPQSVIQPKCAKNSQIVQKTVKAKSKLLEKSSSTKNKCNHYKFMSIK